MQIKPFSSLCIDIKSHIFIKRGLFALKKAKLSLCSQIGFEPYYILDI